MPPVPPGTVTIPYLGTTLPPIAVMIRYFGPQGDPSREVTISFAGHPVQINRVLAGNLAAAGRAIEHIGLGGYIRAAGGFRTSIGGSGSPIPYSMHQFGAAMDINEDGGPNGNWQTMTMDPRIVAVMRSYHWWWGGNWGGASYDGGHFQFMGGTVPAGLPPMPVAPGPGPAHSPLMVVGVLVALFGAAALLVVLAGAGVAATAVWAGRKAMT